MSIRVRFGSGSCQFLKKRVLVLFGSFKKEGSSSVRVRFEFGSIPISMSDMPKGLAVIQLCECSLRNIAISISDNLSP